MPSPRSSLADPATRALGALAIACLSLSFSAQESAAASLGLDTASKALIGDFTADFVSVGDSRGTVSGTANGSVTWTLDTTSFLPFSNGTGAGGSSGNIAPQAANDWFHIGPNFTLTFSESISAILFTLSDNDSIGNDILNTGTAPEIEGTVVLDDTTVRMNSASGGFALFTGLSGTTFTSMATDIDGSNIAFAVLTTADAAPVPLPASLPLVLAGLGGLVALQRRRRK